MNESRAPWWKQENVAVGVAQHVKALATSSWRRRREKTRALALFMFQRDQYRVGAMGASAVDESGRWTEDYLASDTRPSLNVSRQLAEVMATRLFREIPAATVVVRGGSFETSLAAEEMSDVLASSTGTSAGQQRMRDIGQSGVVTGFVACMPRVTASGVEYLEVPYEHLYCDPRAAPRSEPLSLFYTEYIDRQVLLARVQAAPIEKGQKKNLTEAIERMPARSKPFHTDGVVDPYERELREAGLGDLPSDVLMICHAWHLPGAQGGDDGRYHLVLLGSDDATGSQLIESRPWKRTTFPICWFAPYRNPAGGIDGMGVMDLVHTHQRIIDRYAEREDEHLDFAGNTKVITHGDDMAVQNDFAADGVTFISTPLGQFQSGRPYEVVPGNPQSLQALAWLDRIEEAAYRAVGVNQMMSQGLSQRGAGASGVAMMEEEDRQADRLADVESRWDRFLERVAEETLNAMDDELEHNPDFKLQYEGPLGDESARWDDLRSPTRDFHIAVELTGQRARTRAGRIARIFEMVDRGAFDAGLSLAEVTGSADFTKLSRLQQAGLRLVEWQLAGLAIPRSDSKQYAPYWPTAETPYAQAISLAKSTIQIATTKRAKPETIGRLREYLMTCERGLRSQQPPAPPPMAPPGPPMPGAPGLPPEAAALMAAGGQGSPVG